MLKLGCHKIVIITSSLKARLRRVRPEKTTTIEHDNTRPHKSQQTKAALDCLGLKTLPHLHIDSPDLALCDFFLKFLKLKVKEDLGGSHHKNDNAVESDVRTWCRGRDAEFYAGSIQQFVQQWRLCIKQKDDNIEK